MLSSRSNSTTAVLHNKPLDPTDRRIKDISLAKKLHFLCKEVKILGQIITNDGICMDPEKVDSILKWKVPTNRALCRGFIRSVGYLADDIYKVRIPLGVLSEASAETQPFRWSYTEQRAFDTIKQYIASCAPHSHMPIDHGPNHDPIWIMIDACGNGIGGVVAQGPDWKSAQVAAFYSAKMSSAQQNYPVHEQEMLAGVETMLQHRDILQGAHFTWVTVTTMSNSGPYPVTLVALTYSGHGRAVILPLRTTLGLIPIQSLLHLAVYPALM